MKIFSRKENVFIVLPARGEGVRSDDHVTQAFCTVASAWFFERGNAPHSLLIGISECTELKYIWFIYTAVH